MKSEENFSKETRCWIEDKNELTQTEKITECQVLPRDGDPNFTIETQVSVLIHRETGAVTPENTLEKPRTTKPRVRSILYLHLSVSRNRKEFCSIEREDPPQEPPLRTLGDMCLTLVPREEDRRVCRPGKRTSNQSYPGQYSSGNPKNGEGWDCENLFIALFLIHSTVGGVGGGMESGSPLQRTGDGYLKIPTEVVFMRLILHLNRLDSRRVIPLRNFYGNQSTFYTSLYGEQLTLTNTVNCFEI